jgi:hypothetical protein
MFRLQFSPITKELKPNSFASSQQISKKVLRNIVDAPWYVRNADLHRNLKMEMFRAEIRRFARKHEERLLHHDNVEAIQLLDNSELLRRLKRTKPFELVSWTLNPEHNHTTISCLVNQPMTSGQLLPSTAVQCSISTQTGHAELLGEACCNSN